MDKFQKIGVTAFIKNVDKVLILRRSEKESFLSGYYELPGGKVDFGENPEDALKREIIEEAGIVINLARPYSLFSYVSSDGNRHTVDIQFIAEIAGPNEIKLSDAHDDYAWVKKEELENYKISELMLDSIFKGFDQK